MLVDRFDKIVFELIGFGHEYHPDMVCGRHCVKPCNSRLVIHGYCPVVAVAVVPISLRFGELHGSGEKPQKIILQFLVFPFHLHQGSLQLVAAAHSL